MSAAGIASPNGATRVLIADDHPVTCIGLASLITTEGWQVCATATDGDEVVAKANQLRPDIVIMDYTLPHLNGLEAASQIKRTLPGVEILIYSGARSPHILLEIFHSSARGCLLKTEAPEELMPALESLRRHHRFRSREITDLCEKIESNDPEAQPLTPRETQTLRLIINGKSAKEAAEILGISVKTARTHREHLYKKLKIHSVAGVILYALQHGLVDL